MNEPSSTPGALLAALTLLGTGCYEPPSAGGQSGTDGKDDGRCSAHAIASDPRTAQTISRVQGRHAAEGTWLNGRQASGLIVEVAGGAALPIADEESCSGGYAVDAHVYTSDGLIDGRASILTADDRPGASFIVTVPDLPEAYRHPAVGSGSFAKSSDVDPALLPATKSEAKLEVDFWDGEMEATLLVEDGNSIGIWSTLTADVPSRAPAPPYIVPTQLANDCASASDLTTGGEQYSAFASAGAVSAALVGTWVRCVGTGAPELAGLQIGADGSIRGLISGGDQGGTLLARGGFGYEGRVLNIVDTGGDQKPGFFQIDLSSVGSGFLSGDKLILLADAPTPLFVRSQRPVADTTVPYAPGEHAGVPACSAFEDGLVDPAQPVAPLLRGEWSLCQGDLLEPETRLRFDGLGSAEFFGARGESLGIKTFFSDQGYEYASLSSPVVANTLSFSDGTLWDVSFSERPLKLRVGSGLGRSAVFSALP